VQHLPIITYVENQLPWNEARKTITNYVDGARHRRLQEYSNMLPSHVTDIIISDLPPLLEKAKLGTEKNKISHDFFGRKN